MKLKPKFILFGAVMVVTVIAHFGVERWAGNAMSGLDAEQERSMQVVQRHMEADMQHDAIRAAVLAGVLAMTRHDAAALEKARQDMAEDYAVFAENIATNLQEALPQEVHDAMETVQAKLKPYHDSAAGVLSQPDADAAYARLDNFEAVFEALEKDQAAVSERLLKHAEQSHESAAATREKADRWMIVIALISMAISIGVPVYAVMSVFRPMERMMAAMDAIASGDSGAEVPYLERKDEIGTMARSVQVFKDNAQRVQGIARDKEELDKRQQEEKRAAMERLAADFEHNVKNVVDMVASAATEMDATAKSVAGIAEGSRGKLSVLTGEVTQATDNVQTVANAAGELSSAITEINRQVARATSITHSAVEEAGRADGTVQQLAEAAQKIGEVVNMINSIAEQINLLALNATIEAARAGDAGKGFAVVASEVKSLATQTTKATDEITSYISSIQSSTHDTVNVIKGISGTIREINEISTAIAAAVEEQGVATQNIASNVKQAADSTQGAVRDAGAVAVSAEETGNAAHQLTAATTELSRQAETLRTEVNKFLVGIRAA